MSMSVRRTAELPDPVTRYLPPALSGANTVRGRYDLTQNTITIDWSAYYHHSSTPVVVALDSLLDPMTAIKIHAKIRLLDMLEKVPVMDDYERRLLAAVGGIEIAGNRERDRTAFVDYLLRIVRRPALMEFFEIDAAHNDHYAVRPVESLAAPKGDSRPGPLDRALLVTVLALYNIKAAREKFKRDWNPPAVEAITMMNTARDTGVKQFGEVVSDWYGLMATYPGW